MFFKKKKIEAVTERTEDTVPFVIPQIEPQDERKGYKKNKFVSPIFGTKVKDEVVIPNPHKRSGDIDRQLDTFRINPKMSKEDIKKKYGTEYPEFDLVSGSNLNEAMENQGNKTKKQNNSFGSYDEFEEATGAFKREDKELVYKKPYDSSKTSITDFFDKEAPKTVEEEPTINEEEVNSEEFPISVNKNKKGYQLPPFSLLSRPLKKSGDSSEWIQKQIDVLNRTFEEFSVGASVYTHTKGPTVTRYEVILNSGVNIRKVTGISDNIKMALAAKEIRIEAPIPGKSTIGIEVPNEVPEIVHFIDIVNQEEFLNAKEPLTVALGLDIDGKGVYASVSKMPHALVAGATGSGKSVCINTILMSLLFKYTPDQLKLVLIDPKMVELSAYNDIPHLITPVITDAKIATAGLKWAVDEMERRFQLFSNEQVKDISSYNEKISKIEDKKIMPYIVIVVDELADLMVIASRTVEDAIMRLTQKARACGIHLIIATQRPSTDVIKGTIKSNIPTRLAFMVSSYVDSMTIIDSVGADKLLGRGDMLFAESGQPQRRVQGAYLSDTEINNVNEFIRRQRTKEYFFSQEKLVKKATSMAQADDLLTDVARYVVEKGEASINKISKKFKIGFNRAQKIVESLSDIGIVSDNVGSKARSVLVNSEELEEVLNEN